MPDAGLNCCPAIHPIPQAFSGSSASALINMNIDIACVSVTAVAHVHKHMLRRPDNSSDLLESVFQGVTIVWIAVNRFGTDEPASAAGGGNTDFAAELITLVCFAFADALYCRFMDAVDLVLVFALLMKNTSGDIQQGL